jgi:hypothetical protein
MSLRSTSEIRGCVEFIIDMEQPLSLAPCSHITGGLPLAARSSAWATWGIYMRDMPRPTAELPQSFRKSLRVSFIKSPSPPLSDYILFSKWTGTNGNMLPADKLPAFFSHKISAV